MVKKLEKVQVLQLKKFVQEQNGPIPKDLDSIIDKISKLGGTPWVLAVDSKIYGVIYLKDTVKPGPKKKDLII